MKDWRSTGGQSVPAFDHYMAPGVAKTFIKELHKVLCIRYPESVGENGEAEIDGRITADGVKDQLRRIREHDSRGLILNHLEEVRYLLKTHFICELSDKDIESCVAIALKYTKDATNQSMEAVVHNLNSMHSRAGRGNACPNIAKAIVLAV